MAMGRHSRMPCKSLRCRNCVYEAMIRLVTLKLNSQKVTRLSLSINHRRNACKAAGGLKQSYKLYEVWCRLRKITASLHGVSSHVIG